MLCTQNQEEKARVRGTVQNLHNVQFCKALTVQPASLHQTWEHKPITNSSASLDQTQEHKPSDNLVSNGNFLVTVTSLCY